jgi:hypothetical protein
VTVFRRRRQSASTAATLRAAIDALPAPTRAAMLAGIRSERIVAGAYTDGRGGACPMLAAHRRGARTSGAEFARAWDRFTGATRPVDAQPAQLRSLERMLVASLEPRKLWLRELAILNRSQSSGEGSPNPAAARVGVDA